MKNKSNYRNLSADKRIILVLVIFSVCVCGMVGATYLAINALSASQSLGALKSNYRSLRLNAVQDLDEYIRTRDPAYYEDYLTSIEVLNKYAKARDELIKPKYNHTFVINTFKIQGRNLSAINDIPNMIGFFRQFQNFEPIQKALILWGRADSNIADLDNLSKNIHSYVQSGKTNQDSLTHYSSNVELINVKFDRIRMIMNTTSNQATEWMKHFLWQITLGIGFALLLLGGVSTTYVLQSSRQMRNTIEENEQRFRSLFDNNPNAVFLKNLDGEILYSNHAATFLTGYSNNELRKIQFEQIVDPDQRSRVKDNFASAASGISRHTEVDCRSKDGRHLMLDLTNIPIYVNRECVGVFGIAEDITTRKRQEKQIRDTLREKEILLSEIHHRVKNNLALINSLLDLQVHHSGKPELSRTLADAQRRVHSMAKVHELLYQESSFSDIDLKNYIHNLTQNIAVTFSKSYKNIRFKIEANAVRLNINKAIPLGLILNELITNAYKHSFEPDQKGTIFINCNNNDEWFTLTVLTSGANLPENFDPESHNTMGMTLIRTLSTQIDAQLDVVRNAHEGFRVRFKSEKT